MSIAAHLSHFIEFKVNLTFFNFCGHKIDLSGQFVATRISLPHA